MDEYIKFKVEIIAVKDKILEIEPMLLPSGITVSEVTYHRYNNINVGDIVTVYLIGDILALKM